MSFKNNLIKSTLLAIITSAQLTNAKLLLRRETGYPYALCLTDTDI
ncbi:hypothetical protein HMPREF9370_1342 [Neisseria wadsworthii 9715]|uniref:Uncharacterized protein n=1 Tax=Neisseria wadsworthii 9715 TaxID=1030841 RepID=G4CQI2_9NEIS|nr:hypothetical protein HMPREF9370_1342 [Neisseria wadsworthii 9715]